MRGHVLFQAARLSARVGTGRAFEGFFSGVRHQMLFQIAAGGGRVVASVAPIRLFPGVRRDVLFQPPRFATRVRTSRTLVRLLACLRTRAQGHILRILGYNLETFMSVRPPEQG